MAYGTAQVRAVEGRMSGLPPKKGDWANKRAKTCPAWKVTRLSQSCGFPSTFSHLHLSRNRAADEDAASPSAPLVRHEGRVRTALTFRFLYWCQHRCALAKYARWSGVADRLHNACISIKHWHTVKHWLNNNQNHAIPKLRWISMLLYP